MINVLLMLDVAVEVEGEDEDWTSLTLLLPTFITFKGRNDRPADAPSPLLPCRFMTSSDAAQSSGAQVPSLQSLSLKTHSV